MTGKLSSRAQVRLAMLSEFQLQAQRTHALVEQYAAARTGAEPILMALKRALGQLRRDLLGGGFEQLAQLAGSMETAAGRGNNPLTRVRILREGVGSIKSQIEIEQRLTVSEDVAAQDRDRPRG